MKCKAVLLLMLGAIATPAAAETLSQQSGWAGWFNSVRLNEHWGVVSDVQLRSESGWDDVQNVLLRPGLSYIAGNHQFTLGYAWVGTLNRPDGDDRIEHRIWQQYIYSQRLHSAALTHRVRLEQRFVDLGSEHAFAQRLRYFLRGVLPLSGAAKFEQGAFVALQNEVFLNLQHRNVTNGQTFDQNRAYAAVGWRFSKQLDLELGYMNQYVNGTATDTMNHIVQLALYTRF